MDALFTTFVFSALYKFAQDSKLLDFIKEQSQEALQSLIHDRINDTVNPLLDKFFSDPIEKAFTSAFKGIAPKNNKLIRRRFLLAFFSNPAISQAMTDMNNGITPQLELLVPILQELHIAEPEKASHAFINTMYRELRKDQELVNGVVLTIPEKLKTIENLVIQLKDEMHPSEKPKPFFVPEPPAYFVGRIDLLKLIKERLAGNENIIPVVGGSTLGLYGMPGVGKTCLAIKLAHDPDVYKSFDGIFYQFCGDSPAYSIAAALAEKAGLDISKLAPEKQITALKNHLAPHRYLLILDDVRDNNIHELIPGGRVTALVTTRRHDLDFLALQNPISLEVFTEPECFDLYRAVLGERIAGKGQAAKKIFAFVGRLPVAVAVSAGMLKEDVRWTLDSLVEFFTKNADHRLQGLKYRQFNVSLLLDKAIEELPETEELLLCAISACAEDGFCFSLPRDIAGLKDEAQAFQSLQGLIDRSLVRELDREKQRYFLHTLIRSAARSRGTFTGLEEEHAQRVAELLEDWETNWKTCVDLIPDGQEALAYTIKNKNMLQSGRIAFNSFALCYRVGRLNEALKFMQDCGYLFQELGNKDYLQRTYCNLALILQVWGRFDEAMELLIKQEKLCLELSNIYGLQASYGNQANIFYRWGHHDEAMALYNKSEKLCLELGNKQSLQANYGNRASIFYIWGRLDEAMELYKKQEILCLEMDNKYSLQTSYGNQANIFYAWVRLDEAMVLLKKKEKLCLEIGSNYGLQASYGNQANIFYARGQFEEAMKLHKKQEQLCLEIGDKVGLARCRYNMALIYFEKKDLKTAKELAQFALSFFQELNMPRETQVVEDFLKELE